RPGRYARGAAQGRGGARRRSARVDTALRRRLASDLAAACADPARKPLMMSSSEPSPTTVEFRVRYAETDQMGVVYHANYLVWCEIGRTDLIRKRHSSYAEVERAGVALAVSEASLR